MQSDQVYVAGIVSGLKARVRYQNYAKASNGFTVTRLLFLRISYTFVRSFFIMFCLFFDEMLFCVVIASQ